MKIGDIMDGILDFGLEMRLRLMIDYFRYGCNWNKGIFEFIDGGR